MSSSDMKSTTKDSMKKLNPLTYIKNIYQNKEGLGSSEISTSNRNLFEISTLRLPIFCRSNKPFVFLKVLNFSEKYRVSVSPDFLKKYNLNFKILRDVSLQNFLNNLKNHHKKILKFPEQEISENHKKDFAQIFLRLPNIDKLQVQKFTITLENDNAPGKTIIDKYEFYNLKKTKMRTTIFIIDRYYENRINSSISFISEEFLGSNGLMDFLDEYYSNF